MTLPDEIWNKFDQSIDGLIDFNGMSNHLSYFMPRCYGTAFIVY